MTPPLISWLCGNVSHAISLLKGHPAFDTRRDVILVRLPIGQGCHGTTSSNWCQKPQGNGFTVEKALTSKHPWFHMQDPVNSIANVTHHEMAARLRVDHPDVGLIDTFSWTFDGNIGRHRCAPTDTKGTHFSTEFSRMAYVYQVLHGARLLGCGKPVT